MRHLYWMGVVAGAAFMLPSGSRMQAQTGGQSPAAGAGQFPARTANGGIAGVNLAGRGVQGMVTASTADTLSIKTDTGDTYAVTFTVNTRVMKDRQAIKATDVKVGDGVAAFGAVDASAKTVQATMLIDVDAATIAKAQEDLGKTYITGRITAIDADNLKLTVMRTDRVSQVIQVDEGTSFQRGMRGIAVPSMGGMGTGGMGGGRWMGGGQRGGAGNAAGAPAESITLADVKVGDWILATGALKGGVFIPLKMGVAGPGAGMRQGAAADGQTAPPAASPTPPQ